MAMMQTMPRYDDRPVAVQTRNDHLQAVDQVIAAMRADVSHPHTIESLAAIANYSPFHFTRLFRSVTGTPPGEFLAALRFDQAKRLILGTTDSITDICFDVGFSSLGTFSTRFKQLVGMSPADLRAMPEPLSYRLPQLGNCPRRQPSTQGASLFGTITATQPCAGYLFIGLFPGAIPQGGPVAGTLMTSIGPFAIHDVKPGMYRLLAAIFPFGDDPMAHLLGGSLLQGADPLPVIVDPEVPSRELGVELRPPALTDAPILSALAPMVLDL